LAFACKPDSKASSSSSGVAFLGGGGVCGFWVECGLPPVLERMPDKMLSSSRMEAWFVLFVFVFDFALDPFSSSLLSLSLSLSLPLSFGVSSLDS
jgi:hypothetical protein